jgi:hypothetical protein
LRPEGVQNHLTGNNLDLFPYGSAKPFHAGATPWYVTLHNSFSLIVISSNDVHYFTVIKGIVASREREVFAGDNGIG